MGELRIFALGMYDLILLVNRPVLFGVTYNNHCLAEYVHNIQIDRERDD